MYLDNGDGLLGTTVGIQHKVQLTNSYINIFIYYLLWHEHFQKMQGLRGKNKLGKHPGRVEKILRYLNEKVSKCRITVWGYESGRNLS